MKTAELRLLTKEEIAQKVTGWKKGLLDLRLQGAAGKLGKSHQIMFAKRDVAKALTLLKELDREESKKGSPAGQKKG